MSAQNVALTGASLFNADEDSGCNVSRINKIITALHGNRNPAGRHVP